MNRESISFFTWSEQKRLRFCPLHGLDNILLHGYNVKKKNKQTNKTHIYLNEQLHIYLAPFGLQSSWYLQKA